MGDGAGGGAESRPGSRKEGRRLGYRPPPRGWAVRLLIVLAMLVFAAVMMRAIADTVVAYQNQVHVIDRNVMRDAGRYPTKDEAPSRP